MAYVTPWSGQLEEGTYEIIMPSNVIVGPNTFNFRAWEDGSTNPLRIVNLTEDTVISSEFDLVVAPPTMGNLLIFAYVNSEAVVAEGLILETDQAFQTAVDGTTIEVPPGTYTVQLTYEDITEEFIVDVAEGQTVRIDGQMTPPEPTPLFPVVRERFYTRVPRPFDIFDRARQRVLTLQIRRVDTRG